MLNRRKRPALIIAFAMFLLLLFISVLKLGKSVSDMSGPEEDSTSELSSAPRKSGGVPRPKSSIGGGIDSDSVYSSSSRTSRSASPRNGRGMKNASFSNHRLPPVVEQLSVLESQLPTTLTRNFDFQHTTPRGSPDERRPHHVSYVESLKRFPIPVPTRCPSSIRPDAFCAPNLGRDWLPGTVVFPISYSLPRELYTNTVPEKTQDFAQIVPRVRGTYRFTSEAEYTAEYARSFYCITFKKGGWDVLRHYEIIAAGCMPYLVDIEYMPVYSLYHLPKQLLLEARDLPGVHFNCSAVKVVIDHSVFPRERYFMLLRDLLQHAQEYLTTEAMAQYVLNVSGKPTASKVLYLAAAQKKAPLRAQGNYNSWTLFHGLRQRLGAGCVDPFKIPFMYSQPKDVANTMRRSLYGLGFGYAFRLDESLPVDRSDIVSKIEKHYYDLIIFADPTSLVSSSSKQIKLLKLTQRYYTKGEILFLHAPDIAYPQASQQGYSPSQLYEAGVVFQREIMDCAYYAPPAGDDRSQAMKRCVWYLNKNCFDDVNVAMTVQEKQLKEYPWKFSESPSSM